MRLSIKTAKRLLELTTINTLPYSSFDKKEIEPFIESGVIDSISIKSKKSLKLKSLEYLEKYLFNNFHITDLEQYVKTLKSEEPTRSELSIVSSDSKIKSISLISGFFINSYNEIYGLLNNEKICLKSTPGSFIFINQANKFKISENITVVFIENFENFKSIDKQKYLFSDKDIVFIWSSNNKEFYEWLSNLPNKYIHFGDFDLSGLMIYINLKNKRKNFPSEFLIPQNIELLINRYGNRERYLNQETSTKNIDFSLHPEIYNLSEIIKKNIKSLEQEVFINLSHE